MLPSPIIEGTLPAFYVDEKGTAIITAPFSMSRAVNRNEVKGFSLILKPLQGSDYLGRIESTSYDYNNMIVKFELTQEIDENGKEKLTSPKGGNTFYLNKGSFYKAQLAYVDKNDKVGYYSTIGIIKYTTKPNVSIANLLTSKNNTHTYSYTGIYSQENMDTTEKIYSYRFVIKNNKNEIVEDTGYLVHNSTNDVEYYESHDEFIYTYDLIPNDKYTITYSVKTNNGLEVSGPSYKIIQKETLPLSIISNITPVLNYDNGYIEVFFNKDVVDEESVNGTFVLSRASEDYQFSNWETIVEFNLFSQKPSDQTWKDFSIEQGKKYKYSIQQYSKVNQLYSQRLISNIILADFEDAFLYDGQRQLKIRFNPKINSFKKNIFEAKVDTLGSKYPFIFRNGNVEYKEFPISGLISYLSDEQSLFGNNMMQFETVEREGVYIYTPFIWETHKNSIIQDTLRRNQYKKNYLFFYIWDSSQAQYIKWTDYLREQYENVYFKEPWIEIINGVEVLHPGVKLVDTKYFDVSDYDKYFDSSKMYYLKTIKEINRLNPDELKLKTTNLISYNISLERDFKMDVLNWLTNGEPKLFRSPSEGNFIVRLMNVSLTPEEKTGRMLHTFNSTAYEIADFNYTNLKEFGFINTSNFKSKYLKIHSIPLILTDKEKEQSFTTIEYIKYGDYWYAQGNLNLIPTAVSTEFMEINDSPNVLFKINETEILLGTGHYETTVPVTSVKLLNNDWYLERDFTQDIPHITIGYLTDIDDSFSIVSNVELKEICGRQFIGYHDNIKTLLEKPLNENEFETQFLSYYRINLYKRMIVGRKPYEDETIDVKCDFTQEGEIAYYNHENILIPFSKNSQKIDLFRYFKWEDDEWGSLYEQYLVSAGMNSQDLQDLQFYVDSKLLYELKNGEFVLVTNAPVAIGTYYLKREIVYIYDANNPKKKYLDDESQRLFEKLWKILGKGEFLDYTMPYFYTYNFNEPKSLKETLWTKLTETEAGPLEYLNISDGLICDITYRTQITKYDISKNVALKGLKDNLDKMLELLSQEGMLRETNAGQENAEEEMNTYIANLNKIYYSNKVGEGYAPTYEAYLEKLKTHIDSMKKYN